MVRRRLLRAVALTVVVVAPVVAVLLGHANERDTPVAVISETQTAVPVVVNTTSLSVPAPPELPPATKTVTEGSSEVVYSEEEGVKVVNSGSAGASTGGNTAVGPGSATVVNGPVSAVGNSSEVRINRP